MKSYSPDNVHRVSADYLRQNPRFSKPHVVVLGAGASKQAFPCGDARGVKLPLMDDLVDTIDLKEKLDSLGLHKFKGNFEIAYNRLYSKPEMQPYLVEIERQIQAYFSKLILPENPTLYDHLLLSLRGTDLIATFNWDPLLYDSQERMASRFGPGLIPPIAFLHGNVRVGYCPDDKVYGRIGANCPQCDRPLKRCPLLYPVGNKDYDADPFIRDAWRMLHAALEDAFAVTIFGYSAPTSDRIATDAMQKAWNGSGERRFETIFIVDTKDDSAIRNTWRSFIFSHHYRLTGDFYDSHIPRFARRSVEGLYVPTIEGKFVESLPIPRHADWDKLGSWLDGLVRYEYN